MDMAGNAQASPTESAAPEQLHQGMWFGLILGDNPLQPVGSFVQPCRQRLAPQANGPRHRNKSPYSKAPSRSMI